MAKRGNPITRRERHQEQPKQPNSSRLALLPPDGCKGITAERGYYKHAEFFIKRSLRPGEFRTGVKGLHVPRLGIERLKNEAESLQYIRRVSDIPVPCLYGAFEIDGSYILITEYIPGVSLSDLSEEQRIKVYPEVNQHLAAFRKIRSKTIGGPAGVVIPPNRVMEVTDNDNWTRHLSSSNEYVFCHNGLSQYNIIVNPTTLRINAFIDWEFAGFYPPYFEACFYKRPGPSVALDGEPDDVPKLLQFLRTGLSEDNSSAMGNEKP